LHPKTRIVFAEEEVAPDDTVSQWGLEAGAHLCLIKGRTPLSNETIRNAVQKWNEGGSACEEVADEFGEIGDWDVSNVTSMSGLFTCANSFNDDISRWDTSSVVDMSRIFNAAISFNQPLEGWDTSSVTNMCSAFDSADSFNQPLEGWDTSSVTDMRFLFYNASAFNQSLEGWDTSSVTAMSNMFFAAGLMTSREKPSWYQHRAEMSGDQRHAAHPSWF